MTISGATTIWKDKTLWKTVALALPFLAVTVIEPLGYDNALYKSMAVDLVRYGRIPYIGSFDQNFPGIVYIHSVAVLLFGNSDIGFRLVDIAVQLLFVGFLYRFLSRWFSAQAAWLAAVLYALYYVSGGVSLYGQRDIYGGMALLAGLGWMLPKSGEITLTKIAMAGLAMGVSVLIRPTGLLFVAIASCYFLLTDDLRVSQRGLPKAALLFGAALVPIGIVLLYYATVPGGLEAFYLATIRFNLDLYARLNSGISFWFELLRSALLFPLAVYAIFPSPSDDGAILRRLSQKERLLYAILIAAALLVVIVMGKYYRYQFAPLFMLVIPLTACGAWKLTNRIASPKTRTFALTSICFLSSFVSYNPTSPIAFAKALWSGTDPVRAAYEARSHDPFCGARQEIDLRYYLSGQGTKDASIEICSNDPRLRSHLDRPVLGKYAVLFPLAIPTNGGSLREESSFTPYQHEWRRDYFETLKKQSPEILLLARHTRLWNLEPYDSLLHWMPGFDSLLATRYRHDTSFGGFEVYRRK